MPRQGRTGHVPVSRGYLCHEQKRCQWADFLEETVHGMCQASAGAASCTAAEIRPAAAAERFWRPRLDRLADSNWTRPSGETDEIDGSSVSDQYDPTHPFIGCCQCAEIVCELCRHSPDPHNAFRQNAGHAGCGSFKVSTYNEHEAKYHPKVEQARAIHKSLEEQQASEDASRVHASLLARE